MGVLTSNQAEAELHIEDSEFGAASERLGTGPAPSALCRAHRPSDRAAQPLSTAGGMGT